MKATLNLWANVFYVLMPIEAGLAISTLSPDCDAKPGGQAGRASGSPSFAPFPSGMAVGGLAWLAGVAFDSSPNSTVAIAPHTPSTSESGPGSRHITSLQPAPLLLSLRCGFRTDA